LSLTYKIDSPSQFSTDEKEQFLALLKKQNKVLNINIERIERCYLLCCCFDRDNLISIGAIKPKTVSDFSQEKANLPELVTDFKWELGYFYTEEIQRGKEYHQKSLMCYYLNVQI
jgi:hypothetical protein